MLKDSTMRLRVIGLIIVVGFAILATPLAAAAQPAGKMPRLGVIMQGIPPSEAGDELDRTGISVLWLA